MRLNPLDEVRSTWVVGVFIFVFYFIIGTAYAFLQQIQANQNLFSQGELFTLESLLFSLIYLLNLIHSENDSFGILVFISKMVKYVTNLL